MKYLLLTTTFFATVTLTAVSQAQPGGGIARFDQDGDGLVSREEFATPPQRRGPRLFERADSDGDGAVTYEELQTTITERSEKMAGFAEQRFGEMDLNGDQVLTREEVLEHGFSKADADGDGFISEDEARANREHMRGHRRGNRSGG